MKETYIKKKDILEYLGIESKYVVRDIILYDNISRIIDNNERITKFETPSGIHILKELLDKDIIYLDNYRVGIPTYMYIMSDYINGRWNE